jgi:hypothetical protein
MAKLSSKHLPHLECVLDFENHFKQVNTAWQYNLGIATDNLLTTTFTHWIHPDDVVPTQRYFSQLYAGKRDWTKFETRWRDTTTNYHQLLWIATVSLTEHLVYAVGLEMAVAQNPCYSQNPPQKDKNFIVCY